MELTQRPLRPGIEAASLAEESRRHTQIYLARSVYSQSCCVCSGMRV